MKTVSTHLIIGPIQLYIQWNGAETCYVPDTAGGSSGLYVIKSNTFRGGKSRGEKANVLPCVSSTYEVSQLI